MDAKITLSFDKEVIMKAKSFANANNISLSRLTEFLYYQITSGHYKSLEELPISDWVNKLAEGDAEYRIKPRNRKLLKREAFEARK
jgi:hypothetical protein